ncbi:MAG: GNAT family N-acetyltransferase, partial [Pseudomonadota bacterium]
SVNDVVKDYDAVTTSKDHLHERFGPGWPEGLTLEQNLIDLGWHQKEFQTRSSFAYTVVSLDESRVLGCLYINPTRKADYDAVVYLWARQSEIDSGLELALTKVVQGWLAHAWPFERPGYPGIEMSHDEWEKLEERAR